MAPVRFPLLRAQRDIWFGHMLDETGCVYNTGLYTELAGALDLAILHSTAAHVVARTDSLRLRFHATDDDLWQKLAPAHEPALSVVDATGADDPHATGLDLVDRDLRAAFDLTAEPPFRWLLVRTGEQRWLWSQIYHHIGFDGQSAWIVSNRVAETYSALLEGREAPDYPEGGIATLTGEEAAYRASPRFLEDRRFWTASLGNRERMKSWSFGAGPSASANTVVRATCELPAPLSAKVRDLARQAGLRPEHFLMAAAAILQSTYQGQQEVVLGTQLLGRLASSAKAFPAMASNECQIRLTVSPALAFEALAKDISRQIRLALRHQSYRYEDLRHDLGLLPGEPDGFSLSVNIMPVDSDLPFSGLDASSHYLSFGPVRDLSLTLFDNKALARLRLDLDGNGALYRPSDVREHLSRIVALVEQIATEAAPLGALVLTDDAVPQPDDVGIAETTDRNRTLPDLLAATVPSRAAIAVAGSDGALTHDELARRSNRLARYLIGRGVGPGSLVAIALPRTADMVAVVLAILKAGGACLPLDLNYPAERLGHMLTQSGTGLLVTQRGRADAIATAGIETVLLGDPALEDALARVDFGPVSQQERTAPLDPQDIAFLLYTSGSTGKPKGVGLTHRNLVGKLLDQIELWQVDGSSRFALSSSVSFDPSLHQMLLPLVTGGTCIVLSSQEMGDPDLFVRALAAAGVTHLDIVPSFAAVIADRLAPPLAKLEVFILGGEVLPAPLAHRLRASLPACRFFNNYGPTETCIDATSFEIAADFSATTVPIGRALPHYGVHILDACLRPLPRGAEGEIYISGPGVARGYWRQPGLTAERFLPCPFGRPGERMYRTGDVAYRDANGDIVFCGRSDEQVKLRGFRIELAEIETALLGHPGVEQAIVVLEGSDASARLVAYVSAAAGVALQVQALRAGVARSLPDFMVPAAIALLKTVPRLANGKVDRKSLPGLRHGDAAPKVAPATEMEAHLCRLFGSLLGVEPVSALDNFFALGGHSLLMMQLVSRLRREQGYAVPIDLVFTHPTPRALAEAISARAQSPSLYRPVLPLRESGSSPPLWCVHPAAGLAQAYRRLTDSIDPRIPIHGLQARGVEDDTPPHASIADMAEAYVEAVRELQPRGPYYLMGWSFGGVVAHAMAGLLEADGEEVARLFLIDTYFSAVAADAPAPPEMAPGVLEAFRRSPRLLAAHTPRRIRAPVVFLRASDNVDPTLGASLATITDGAIAIEPVAAGHYALFDPPHVTEVGAILNRYLN